MTKRLGQAGVKTMAHLQWTKKKTWRLWWKRGHELRLISARRDVGAYASDRNCAEPIDFLIEDGGGDRNGSQPARTQRPGDVNEALEKGARGLIGTYRTCETTPQCWGGRWGLWFGGWGVGCGVFWEGVGGNRTRTKKHT